MIEVEGVKPDDFTMASATKKFRKGGEFSGSYSRGQSSGGYPSPLFNFHCRLQLRFRRRQVSLFLSLEVISRLRHFQIDLYLTPEIVMDVERLYRLGNIVQNTVTDPQ